MHMCAPRECSGYKTYQYQPLQLCEKCGMVFTPDQLAEHEKECKVQMAQDDMVCPLCGVILKGGEDALCHYSELRCQANPRTGKEFQEIIRQKVEK